jgi:hypothetical protein
MHNRNKAPILGTYAIANQRIQATRPKAAVIQKTAVAKMMLDHTRTRTTAPRLL